MAVHGSRSGTSAFALVLASICGATVNAQVYLPGSLPTATTELNSASNYPWMRNATRVQCAYAVSEFVPVPLTVQQVAFRYDGPAPAASGTYRITTLTLLLGTSTRATTAMGSDFDANLSQPLTTVVHASDHAFIADGLTIGGPESFGGPNGQFLFPLSQPVLLSPTPTGSVVFEWRTAGNTNTFSANALLDLHLDQGALQPGAQASHGVGCAPLSGLGFATLLLSGAPFVPGSALSIHGQGFVPGAPVATLLGAARLPTPIPIPGTPCTLGLSPAALIVVRNQIANSAGSLLPYTSASMLPIPPAPSLTGGTLHLQAACVGPTPWPGNTLGLQTSNVRSVTIGIRNTPTTEVWFAAHHLDAQAQIASYVAVGAFAVRLQ